MSVLGLITTCLLLIVAWPRPASAGHCNLSADTGNGPVTTLSQLASRPNVELQCNTFNARSLAEGQPRSAPGFNPFRLLAFEQQLTSHITLTGDNPLCRPLAVGVGQGGGGTLASLANCVDRFILSSLQPGQITGNPFGMLVSFPAHANQTPGIQPDDVGTLLFSNTNNPLQSTFDPNAMAAAFDSGTTNDSGSFTNNPITHVGVLLSVANTSLLPGRLGSLRTVQVTTAGLKSFGMAFGNDFALNTVTGSSLQRPGRRASMNDNSAYVELASAHCPAPDPGRATVCSRLTVVEEVEGAVGDENVAFGAGDSSEMFFLLTSFHTSVIQADGLNSFDKPVVHWRQRVDEGLFVMDTLGSFIYNDGSQNPLQVPNTTYVTGQTQTMAGRGPLGGGLSSFANLISVQDGVCFPGGFAADTTTNCPGPPQAPSFP